ncbi:DUF6932 family protein [Micromonospora echinospora]|uniref:DUF6932 family protein n=1 Tax=Micromonospora echinospora TaxID=1877 RepID=UPI003CE9B659
MIPPLDPETGYLPRGRFPSTEEEIARHFVTSASFEASTTRREIWEHWSAVKDFVQSRIPTYTAWLGGSFVTAKLDPGDLDVTWLWDADAWDQLDPYAQQELAPFASGQAGAANHRLRLDSYVIFWRGHAMPNLSVIQVDPYFSSRGYWDDWWMRARSGSKEDPPKLEDANLRRGYLEVTFREFC